MEEVEIKLEFAGFYGAEPLFTETEHTRLKKDYSSLPFGEKLNRVSKIKRSSCNCPFCIEFNGIWDKCKQIEDGTLKIPKRGGDLMRYSYKVSDFGEEIQVKLKNASRGVDINLNFKKPLNESSMKRVIDKAETDLMASLSETAENIAINFDTIKEQIDNYLEEVKQAEEIEKLCNKTNNTKILPDIVNGYIVPHVKARQVMSAINRGRNVLIVGGCGCGKSQLVQELAKHFKKDLSRINLNGGTTDASLIGEKGLRADINGNTETFFQYGALPNAMRNGHWLLLDELDFAQPEYLAVLQAVFEGNGTPLTLLENGGEKIYPHKDFRIIATANTLGKGDKGGYHGTNMLNIATLDRWAIIQMDYTEKEHDLLYAILDNKLLVDKLMKIATRVRGSIKSGVLSDFALSTRRLIHWAESIRDNTMLSFREATELELTGRLTQDELSIIGEMIKDELGI